MEFMYNPEYMDRDEIKEKTKELKDRADFLKYARKYKRMKENVGGAQSQQSWADPATKKYAPPRRGRKQEQSLSEWMKDLMQEKTKAEMIRDVFKDPPQKETRVDTKKKKETETEKTETDSLTSSLLALEPEQLEPLLDQMSPKMIATLRMLRGGDQEGDNSMNMLPLLMLMMNENNTEQESNSNGQDMQVEMMKQMFAILTQMIKNQDNNQGSELFDKILEVNKHLNEQKLSSLEKKLEEVKRRSGVSVPQVLKQMIQQKELFKEFFPNAGGSGKTDKELERFRLQQQRELEKMKQERDMWKTEKAMEQERWRTKRAEKEQEKERQMEMLNRMTQAIDKGIEKVGEPIIEQVAQGLQEGITHRVQGGGRGKTTGGGQATQPTESEQTRQIRNQFKAMAKKLKKLKKENQQLKEKVQSSEG